MTGSEQFVTDGGLETDLLYNRGFDLPDFAAFPLLDDERGRQVMTEYYEEYAAIAAGRAPACAWRRRPGAPTPTGARGSATTPRRSPRSTGRRSASSATSGSVGPTGSARSR